MKVMKTIFIIAIFMAITLTLTMKNIEEEEKKPPFKLTATSDDTTSKGVLSLHENKLMPSKRVSRFLAEGKNPRLLSAYYCHEDNEKCPSKEGENYTCCNKNCINMTMDHNNCGKCNKKCKYTEACCRGECVDLAFDKRHCRMCDNRCLDGEYCVYGMCDYA